MAHGMKKIQVRRPARSPARLWRTACARLCAFAGKHWRGKGPGPRPPSSKRGAHRSPDARARRVRGEPLQPHTAHYVPPAHARACVSSEPACWWARVYGVDEAVPPRPTCLRAVMSSISVARRCLAGVDRCDCAKGVGPCSSLPYDRTPPRSLDGAASLGVSRHTSYSGR